MFPPVLGPIGVRLRSTPTWEEGCGSRFPAAWWETGEPGALDLLLSPGLRRTAGTEPPR